MRHCMSIKVYTLKNLVRLHAAPQFEGVCHFITSKRTTTSDLRLHPHIHTI